jgi:hypothetical protein
MTGDLGIPAIVGYELRYGLLRLPQEAAAPCLTALAQLLRPCSNCLLMRIALGTLPAFAQGQPHTCRMTPRLITACSLLDSSRCFSP